MNNKLYVGNLAYSTMEHQLREAFAPYGEVVSATLVVDRMSGQSRGFCFVEMATADAAQKAIADLNGKDFAGRSLRVDVAEERRPRGDGGGGGDRGGGGRPHRRGGR